MPTRRPSGVSIGTGLRGQVVREEFGERTLADEADAGAVALVVHGQRLFVREPADLVFRQFADRKQRAREHGARHGVQEIRLVLAGIEAAQQPAILHPRVVAGGEPVGAEAHRVLITDAELDLAIAGDVGIGRAAGRELVEEVLEDAVPVFCRERHGVQRDAEVVADASRVLQVGRRRAVTVLVFVPVAHEQRVHVVARALQQHGGDGGIDAAGDREDDAGGGHAANFTFPAPSATQIRRGWKGRYALATSSRSGTIPRAWKGRHALGGWSRIDRLLQERLCGW